MTRDFHQLFEKYGIDITGDILEQIKNMDTKGNERFFSDFIYFWGLLCQIRNTDGELDEKIKKLEREEKGGEITEQEKFDVDFVLSPVEPFFDSRKAKEFSKKYDVTLPQNGDDNGAYNIARKGIIILKDKLPNWYEENKELKFQNKKEKFYPDLYISHKDWDDFAVKINFNYT